MSTTLTEIETERQKWEKPYTYQPYPKMLYRVRLENGKPVPDESCIVTSDRERAQREREGFHAGGPQAALDAHHRQQQDIAEAAAEAQYQANRLSTKAQAEYAAADEASDVHLTGQELGTRRPGRPKKPTE